MYACCDQDAPVRTNTYAAPDCAAELSEPSPSTPVAALSSPLAPTASVLPSLDSATLVPNKSSASVFEALTYACWLQLAPDASEYVHGSGRGRAVVGLIASDTLGRALLAERSDRER